jgi:hypothetical protein
MGFFGKADYPEDQIQRAPPDPDIEKRVPSHEETPSQPNQLVAAPAPIDPELERRVLRKLDLRVPTLMGFFCMFSCEGVIAILIFFTDTPISLDLLAFLDRSNIGCVHDRTA